MIDITDNRALAQACEQMNSQSHLFLDTEFIRERTYYPVLALIQVGWPGCESLLIDPLPITEWAPFHEVLLNKAVCKVFHAGRQDLEIFYHQMQRMPVNVFDTQIAAAMCGFGEQIGYGALVAKASGVQLVKGSSFTNWLKRPLTEAQLNYARDDVRYLPKVFEVLMARAEDQDRLQWVLEEIKGYLSDSLFDPNPEEIWRKLKKVKSLKSRDAAVLRELAKWRDDVARRINKPVRFLISDESLVEISKISKLTTEQLATRRGVQSGFLERFGADIIGCHRRGRSLSPDAWPRVDSSREKPPSDRAELLADLAWVLVKEIANKASIAPTNLIAKKHLPFYIDAYNKQESLDSFPISHGWRREMVAKPLNDLIEGRLSIRVRNMKIIWQETNQTGEET